MSQVNSSRQASWLHAAKDGRAHAYREKLRQVAAVRKGQLQRRVWYSQANTEEDGTPADYDGIDLPDYNAAKYHFQGRMDLDQAIDTLYLDNKNTNYFMCGPEGFMGAQKTKLEALGVSNDRIHSEGF